MTRIYGFILLTCSGLAYGQSPITLNNTHMPVNNDTLRYTNILLTSIGNYTQTGANFNWDFSNVTSLTEGVRSFKSAFQTPYAFFFIGLNEFGEKIADTLGVGPVAITKYYNFYKKQSNPQAFIADGVGMTFQSIPLPSYYSDKDEIYLFPMTYPKHDSTTFKFTAITTSFVPVGYSKTGYRITDVDGWGTISTPNGTATCLRLITTQYSMDTIKNAFFPIGIPNVQRSYQWLTTTSKIPYLEVTGSLVGNIFTPTILRYRGFKKEIVNTTGIREEFGIQHLSVFPNPTKDELFLKNLVGPIDITIHSVDGRLVEKLTGQAIDRIDVSTLENGMYLLKVSNGTVSGSVKFIKE